MNRPNLSYLIATKNKLSYLKKVLNKLIINKKEDEEIVVIDGKSNDGTQKYLSDLRRKKQIQIYLSEKDLGEAHALNKGLLLTNGTIIKIISDDDQYFYPGIQKCKDFMLKHKNIDVIGAEGSGMDRNGHLGNKSNYGREYQIWLKNRRPFSFCGLALMLRKSSFKKIGLFNIKFVRTDMEYTFRISTKPINIAWYTGFIFIRIINSSSNSFEKYLRVNLEGIKLEQMYLKKINFYQIPLVYIKSFLINIFRSTIINSGSIDISKRFELAEKQINELNHYNNSMFIFNNNL